MNTGRIKVLCERIMSRGFEPRVARLMENVKATVRAQPGFLSIETYAQVDDHTKYVVFSEVIRRVLFVLAGKLDGPDVSLVVVGVQEGLRYMAGHQGVPGVHAADQRAARRAGAAHAHLQDPQGRHLPALILPLLSDTRRGIFKVKGNKDT